MNLTAERSCYSVATYTQHISDVESQEDPRQDEPGGEYCVSRQYTDPLPTRGTSGTFLSVLDRWEPCR
jgi:hypothetical protein